MKTKTEAWEKNCKKEQYGTYRSTTGYPVQEAEKGNPADFKGIDKREPQGKVIS